MARNKQQQSCRVEVICFVIQYIYFENKTLLKDRLYSSLIDDLSLSLPFYWAADQ